MSTAFHTLAFQLLGIDYLPVPRSDGFAGDPYLTDREYQRLAIIVSESVPGMTVTAWRESSESERIAAMEYALSRRSAPDFAPLTVTKSEISWLANRSESTMNNNGVWPKTAVGKRGKASVYRYSDIVANWPEKWEALPSEEDARRMLSTRPKESNKES